MALLTLAEYKETPFYDSTTQTDPNINYFLPFVDDIIIEIRGIDWFTFTADIVSGSTALDNITDNYKYTYPGALIETVESDYLRAKITAKGIDRDNADITVDTAASGTEDTADIYVYPRGAQMVAAELIKYLIEDISTDKTMKSETIGTYSYQRADDYMTVSGFSIPGYIANKIKRYHSVKSSVRG
jgi:hypothetical protein